jgi:hypothetical protein
VESAAPPREEFQQRRRITGPRRPPETQRRARLPWIVAGIALILVGIGAFLVSNAYDTPRRATPLGPNLPVNEGARNPLDLSAHNSPGLVRNPADRANLVVVDRVDSPRYSCALHASFDGGGRWTQTPIPAPRGEEPKCYAPDAAFGRDGTLYVSFVTLKGRANAPNAVWISRSTDGGKTLSPPLETPLGPRSLQVRLIADPRTPDRIYLTWLAASELGLYRFAATGNPIRMIRSDDGGDTWSGAVTVSGTARQRVVAPSPAVGPDGELYVLHLDLGDDALDYEGGHRGQGGPPYDGTWQLVLARSTDRGGTWEESVVEDEVFPTERFVVFTPPTPSMAVDPETGRLYATFQDGRSGDADVLLWSLARNEDRWAGPVRVNDTPDRDGTSQYMPQLAVAPGGRLDVVYYDRRADPTNILNEVSFQSSYDSGESFEPRLRLSDRAFSSRIGFGLERGMPDLGNRLGLVSTDDRAFAVWTDTRSGTRRSIKQDVARGLVGVNDPPRLSGAVEALLRWGGVLMVLLGVAVVVTLGAGLGRRAVPAR